MIGEKFFCASSAFASIYVHIRVDNEEFMTSRQIEATFGNLRPEIIVIRGPNLCSIGELV